MKSKTSFISKTTFSIIMILISFQGFGDINSTNWDDLVSMDLAKDSDYDYINKEFYRYLYSKPDSAFILLEHYNADKEKVEIPLYKSRLYNMYGKFYYLQSEYPKSLEYHTKAIGIFEQNNDLKGLASSYNGKSLVFLGQNNYEKSIEWQRLSLKINESLKDTISISNSLFNMGLAFSELEIFDSAKFYLTKAQWLATKSQSKRIINRVENRLADLNFKKGNVDAAIAGYLEVLENDHNEEIWELVFAWAGLSQCYIAKGEGGLAVKYASLSFENAKLLGAKWDAQRAAELQSSAYEIQGDYKKSLQSFKIFKQLSDSIYNEKKDVEINSLLLVQKELENNRMLSEKSAADQRAKNRLNLIVILILLVFSMLVIGLLAYKNYKKATTFSRILSDQNQQILKHQDYIQQQNKKLTEINQSKDQLFTIISHDLRGPIGSIYQLYKMMENENEDEFDRKAINTFATENLGKIRLMLENVLVWAKTQMQGISVDPIRVNVKMLLNEIYDVVDITASNKSIKLKFDVNESAEFYADLKQSQIIIENVINNAIKFSNINSEIIVTTTDNGEYLNLIVQDFGVGISAEKLKNLVEGTFSAHSTVGTMNEKGTGLGILLVKQLLINNHGSLNIESELNHGTKVILEFPKFPKNEIEVASYN